MKLNSDKGKVVSFDRCLVYSQLVWIELIFFYHIQFKSFSQKNYQKPSSYKCFRQSEPSELLQVSDYFFPT